jgi:hypothetical protein
MDFNLSLVFCYLYISCWNDNIPEKVDSPFATLKQVIRVENDLKIKGNTRQCFNLDIY